jgi:hypothetical protein
LKFAKSDVIHSQALDSRLGARCGSQNTALLRTEGAFSYASYLTDAEWVIAETLIPSARHGERKWWLVWHLKDDFAKSIQR